MLKQYWFNSSKFIQGDDQKFNLVWLFGLAILLILTGLGLRDPWPADEPRFAAIAKEMVETGQWFFPMRGGELYPDKPPIFMWSIAIFYWLTGSIKLSFLLPNVLCALLTLGLVYDLGRRFWSAKVGFHAALLLLFTLQFTLQAKTAQIDAMVCAWITLGCYGLLRHLLTKGNWPWYFIGCFFMGLGVITKGVGFLPILMLIPYVVLRFTQPHKQEIKGNWQWFAGVFFLLGAIMLWFLPMLYLVEHSNNPAFEQYRDNILFKQTAKRYADSWHHIKPFWYYITSVIPVFWLPISLLLPWLVKPWWQAIKASDRRISLPLFWILLLLLFFSFSPGKRGVYILPALPMLALITAPYLSLLVQKIAIRRLLTGLVLLLTTLFGVLASAGFLGVKAAAKLASKYEVEPWSFLLAIALSGVIVLFLVIKNRSKVLVWPLFIGAIWLLYSTWGYQLLSPVKTPKAVLANAAQHMPADAELGLVGLKEQFLLFSPFDTWHFGYHTPLAVQYASAWQWQAKSTKRFIISFNNEQTSCFDRSKAIDLGLAHGEDWLLYPSSARLVDCDLANATIEGFHPQQAVRY